MGKLPFIDHVQKIAKFDIQAENSLIFPGHVFVKFPDFSLILPIFPNSLIFPCRDFFHKIPCFP